MDSEQYVFEVEHLGRLEIKGQNVFKGLEALKGELSPDIRFKILKAHVIKNNDFLVDVSEFVATA